jgi:hypothetical protein
VNSVHCQLRLFRPDVTNLAEAFLAPLFAAGLPDPGASPGYLVLWLGADYSRATSHSRLAALERQSQSTARRFPGGPGRADGRFTPSARVILVTGAPSWSAGRWYSLAW